jgi:1-acyl-sn-glycerol-3-phosphate acyltransferase
LTVEEAHRIARERGPSRVLYWIVRALMVPFMRVWWGLRITGAEHIPPEGAAIVAPNHKSFWDAFFVAAATRRHVRFIGKSELFKGPAGPLLLRLGAFPVRRGMSDTEAIETSLEILRQGGLLAMFPEGTRVRDPEQLGDPRRGVGRLALETGAVIVPAAIAGTERLFLGPFPLPRRVRLAFSEPIEVEDIPATPEGAGELVGGRVWPQVQGEYGRLITHPGVIAAALAALGVGGTVAYRRRGRSRRRGPLGLRRKR